MKEEYVEGIHETPTIIEETVPEQLKGAFGQAAHMVQQLPVPIRDVFSSGLKIPLSKHFDVGSFSLYPICEFSFLANKEEQRTSRPQSYKI